MTPANPPRKPVVRRRGPNNADVEIEEDTTAELDDLDTDLDAAIGPGNSSKRARMTGRNLPLNQPVVAELARHMKGRSYMVDLRIHPGNRDLVSPVIYEFIDALEEDEEA